MIDQMNLFDDIEVKDLDERIKTLETKVKNIRMGLFKRYTECEKALVFLEGEIEDLVKESIGAS